MFDMSHEEAKDLIKNAGNDLELILERLVKGISRSVQVNK